MTIFWGREERMNGEGNEEVKKRKIHESRIRSMTFSNINFSSISQSEQDQSTKESSIYALPLDESESSQIKTKSKPSSCLFISILK